MDGMDRSRAQPPRPRRGLPVAERGPAWSYKPDATPPGVVGAHQPGIVTPLLDALSLAAFDMGPDADARGLRELLAAWTDEAGRRMAAADGALTVALGLGPGLFGARFGLRGARPAALAALPPFPGDALEPAWSGGDLMVMACASTAEAADGAMDAMAVAAGSAAAARWRQRGFQPRRPGGSPSGRPRDLLGFRSGTDNPRRPRDLDRHVWAGRGERTWMVGGTYAVVRRIAVDTAAWAALPLAAQEQVIGRHRESGAPLGGRDEFDPYVLERLPPDAHVRLAAPAANAGAIMLRRSYSYAEAPDLATGAREAGLVFVAFARDLRRQYVPVQRRLAEADALSAFTRHIGSAVFAVPPGARPGEAIGAGMFAAP
jgi:deferrochelatase/peroxidase EfeB